MHRFDPNKKVEKDYMRNNFKVMDKNSKMVLFRNIFAKKHSISTDELYDLIQIENDIELLSIMYVVLGKISDEADVLKICKGLKHSSDIVRRHAVIGLGLITSEYIMTFLFDVLEDKSHKVQRQAYIICKKINSNMLFEYLHFKISDIEDSELLKKYYLLFKDYSLNEEEKKIFDFLDGKIKSVNSFEDVLI